MNDRIKTRQSGLIAKLGALAASFLSLSISNSGWAADNAPFQLQPNSSKGLIAAVRSTPEVQANALYFWDKLDGWKLLSEKERSEIIPALIKVAQTSPEPALRASALDSLVKLDERTALPIANQAFESRDPILRRSGLGAIEKWDAREAAFRNFQYIRIEERIRLLAAAAELGATTNFDAITNLIGRWELVRIPQQTRRQLLPLLSKIAKAIPQAERLDFLAYFVTLGPLQIDQLAEVLNGIPLDAATAWVRRELNGGRPESAPRFYYALTTIAVLRISDLVEEAKRPLGPGVTDNDIRFVKVAAELLSAPLTRTNTPEARKLLSALDTVSNRQINNLPLGERSQELSRLLASNDDDDWTKAFDAIVARADRTDLAFLLEFGSKKDVSMLDRPVRALIPTVTSADAAYLQSLMNGVPTPGVRIPIIQALARLRAVEAVDDIAAILSSSYERSERLAAIVALSDLGNLKNTNDLLKYLTPETDPDLMEAAISAVGKLKVNSAIDPLIELLSQNRTVKPSRLIANALALLDVGDRPATIVEKALQGCSCSLRDNALAALPFALKSPDRDSTVGHLLRLAQDRDSEGRPPIEAMAHIVGGGEPAPEAMIRWLGTGHKVEPVPTKREDAISVLRDIAAAWPSVKKSHPEFRRQLARKIQEVSVAVCTDGKDRASSDFVDLLAKIAGVDKIPTACWHGQEASLIRTLHAALVETGDRSEADALERQLGSAMSEKWLVIASQWFLRIGGLWVALWICLIAAYPFSRSIQSQVFWNQSIRKLTGFGLIDFLLRTIGPLRRLILRPFVRRLAEAARLDEKFAFFDGIRADNAQGHDQGPAIRALPTLRGCCELVGESGLGKSTLLRWLTRKAINEGRAVAFLEGRRCVDGVYPALARLVEGIAKEDSFLMTLIHCRDLAVVIDGVNEVSPDTRARIVDFVSSHADADVLLSTQPILWDEPLPIPQLTLKPLSEDDLEVFLLCFQNFLPPRATVIGAHYVDAVKTFVNDMRSQTNRDVRIHDLTILSNPIDLTIVSELLASGEKPEPSRLDQQIFERAERRWSVLNQGAPFPLEEFAEYCFKQRKNDSRRIEDQHFNDVARVLAESRILIPRTESTKEDSGLVERTFYVFRHERFADFFIFRAFTGPRGAERRTAEIGDGRFRSIYLMIADRAHREIAEETLGRLHNHALATRDLSVYADYYRRFSARTDVSAVVISAKVAA